MYVRMYVCKNVNSEGYVFLDESIVVQKVLVLQQLRIKMNTRSSDYPFLMGQDRQVPFHGQC